MSLQLKVEGRTGFWLDNYGVKNFRLKSINKDTCVLPVQLSGGANGGLGHRFSKASVEEPWLLGCSLTVTHPCRSVNLGKIQRWMLIKCLYFKHISKKPKFKLVYYVQMVSTCCESSNAGQSHRTVSRLWLGSSLDLQILHPCRGLFHELLLDQYYCVSVCECVWACARDYRSTLQINSCHCVIFLHVFYISIIPIPPWLTPPSCHSLLRV